MNISPINNFACGNSNLKNNNLANSTPQAFGMRLVVDESSLSSLLNFSNVKNRSQLQTFLTKKIESKFNKKNIEKIFETTLAEFKKKMGERYQNLKMTDFIPDFDSGILKLKFYADEEGLKGSMSNNAHDEISLKSWTEPITGIIKKYAKQTFSKNDPYSKNL